jgi:hypothetical protein
VIKSRQHFGKLTPWERLFLPMEVFAIWFEKCPCRISKGHGLSVGIAKCYIDDTIIFSLTQGDHVHHLCEVFGGLKEHNLKFHPSKCWFFHT